MPVPVRPPHSCALRDLRRKTGPIGKPPGRAAASASVSAVEVALFGASHSHAGRPLGPLDTVASDWSGGRGKATTQRYYLRFTMNANVNMRNGTIRRSATKDNRRRPTRNTKPSRTRNTQNDDVLTALWAWKLLLALAIAAWLIAVPILQSKEEVAHRSSEAKGLEGTTRIAVLPQDREEPTEQPAPGLEESASISFLPHGIQERTEEPAPALWELWNKPWNPIRPRQFLKMAQIFRDFLPQGEVVAVGKVWETRRFTEEELNFIKELQSVPSLEKRYRQARSFFRSQMQKAGLVWNSEFYGRLPSLQWLTARFVRNLINRRFTKNDLQGLPRETVPQEISKLLHNTFSKYQ